MDDNFHPVISACVGYKYVVSSNPQTGIKLCCSTHHFLFLVCFVLNPSDSADPENRRDFSNWFVTGETGFLLTLGSFNVLNSVEKCRKVIAESLRVFHL